MSTLYEQLFKDFKRNGKRIVSACAQGELHELGLRMVSDFFQADGWDFRYLGANLPAEALVAECRRFQLHVVALSATMLPHVRWVKAAIGLIRGDTSIRAKILVGGRPFIVDPELYLPVGADASAIDCQDALRLASFNG